MKVSYDDFCDNYNVIDRRAFTHGDEMIVVMLIEGATDCYGGHDGYLVVAFEIIDDGDTWTSERCELYLHARELSIAKHVFDSQARLVICRYMDRKQCEIKQLQDEILELEKESESLDFE